MGTANHHHRYYSSMMFLPGLPYWPLLRSLANTYHKALATAVAALRGWCWSKPSGLLSVSCASSRKRPVAGSVCHALMPPSIPRVALLVHAFICSTDTFPRKQENRSDRVPQLMSSRGFTKYWRLKTGEPCSCKPSGQASSPHSSC